MLPQSAKRDAVQNESVHNQLARRWGSLILGILQGFGRRVRYGFTAGFPQETGLSLGESAEHFATYGLAAHKCTTPLRKGRGPSQSGSRFCGSNRSKVHPITDWWPHAAFHLLLQNDHALQLLGNQILSRAPNLLARPGERPPYRRTRGIPRKEHPPRQPRPFSLRPR